jgi:hypothetical protein
VNEQRRRLSLRVAYFAVQAGATFGWWAVIVASPAWRRRFAFGDDGASLVPFLAPDLVFWCLGSLAAAWGEWRGAPWAVAARFVLCGALGSSLLHAASLAARSGAGWLGVLLMLPALFATGWLTWSSSSSDA